MRLIAFICAIFLLGGCATIEQLRSGTTGQTFDPSKIYLRSDAFTVSRNADLDRFVCLTGPLQCNSFGLSWNCECP